VRPQKAKQMIDDQHGFTLAELVGGLSLIGVLLLASGPVLSEMLASYHLRSATHEVFAELQRSRLAAVMQNNPYRFYAVSGSSAYRIHNDVDGDYLEDDGEVTSRYLDQTGLGVQLASSDVVTFLANGTALGSGSISITDGRGGVRHVEVSSGGSIRIR